MKRLDEEKRLACKENGITLIELPHWQIYNKDSLAEILENEIPGILIKK